MDVRPRFIDDYRIKFKAEALPVKDQVGSFRLLYSHNAQFPLNRVHEADRTSMKTLARASFRSSKRSRAPTPRRSSWSMRQRSKRSF
jgi:hypothetical protein